MVFLIIYLLGVAIMMGLAMFNYHYLQEVAQRNVGKKARLFDFFMTSSLWPVGIIFSFFDKNPWK